MLGIDDAITDKVAISFLAAFYSIVVTSSNYKTAYSLTKIILSTLHGAKDFPDLWLNGEKLAL